MSFLASTCLTANKQTVMPKIEVVVNQIARENSWHFAMPPLVSPQNDVWEMGAEIPHWWRITTQIWVVTCHQYGISTIVSQKCHFAGKPWWHCEMPAVFSGYQATRNQVKWFKPLKQRSTLHVNICLTPLNLQKLGGKTCDVCTQSDVHFSFACPYLELLFA